MVFRISRKQAEDLYRDTMYDKFNVPESVTDLRLVCVQGWNLNANINTVLKSTGLIRRIDVTKWKHSQAKETLEVSFTVEGTKAELSAADLASERSLDELPF